MMGTEGNGGGDLGWAKRRKESRVGKGLEKGRRGRGKQRLSPKSDV